MKKKSNITNLSGRRNIAGAVNSKKPMIFDLLQKYPYAGSGIAAVSLIPSVIDDINKVLQCATLSVGLVAAVIAILVNLKKLRKKNDANSVN